MKRPLDFESLGTYLAEKRVRAGLSQREVAKKLGYSNPQFVSNFERGLCSPPFAKLKNLVEIYNIPVSEITELLIQIQRKILGRVFNDNPKSGVVDHTKSKKRKQKA